MGARSARSGERSEEMRARSAAVVKQNVATAASAKVRKKSGKLKAAVQLHSAAFNFPAIYHTLQNAANQTIVLLP